MPVNDTEISAEPTPSGGADRRRVERKAYTTVQCIAPCVDGRLPTKAMFVEVRCHDLSRGGFSYLAIKPPDSDLLVVALGVAPHTMYIKAKVANCVPVPTDDDTPLYRIGCNFVSRIRILT